MRWYLLCLSLILVLLPACAKRRRPAFAEAREGDFSLQAEVIEALEGGPVVLRLTLAYHGKNPAVLLDPPPRNSWFPLELCDPKGYDVSTPKGWHRHD